MKKIFLETFGCQMNVLDSELVHGQLTALGYQFTPQIEEANIVLYNTCSVRELAEQKVLSRLGRLKIRKREDRELIVGVIGCMAERDGATMLKRLPHVDLLCGPSELDQLPTLLENVFLTGRQQSALAGNNSRRSKTLEHAEEDGLELLDLSRSFSATENKYQAYVRIVRGCNKFCTYCVVPYTRGPEVSRSPQAILNESRKLVDAGALEITLLGQTVNHYVYETEVSTPTGPAKRRTTFAELLELLHDGIPQLPRLRFITSFPADFGDDILHVMARSPRICKYLHVPGQSGSNRILKMMNRGYTVEEYLHLLDRARAIVPGIAFAGDIIVGFPTETEEDYQATRVLVEKARYKNCFIFKYSPRPGTVAIKRYEDDVPDAVKRIRNNDILQLQNRICKEINEELAGQTVEILCEGPSGWKTEGESVVMGAAQQQESNPEHPASVYPHLKQEKKEGELHQTEAGRGSRLAVSLKVLSNESAASAACETTIPKARFVRPQMAMQSGWVQLTGRTPSDQIVVFNGPTRLEGTIVRVRVVVAQGLTIFAEIAEEADDEKMRKVGSLGKVAALSS